MYMSYGCFFFFIDLYVFQAVYCRYSTNNYYTQNRQLHSGHPTQEQGKLPVKLHFPQLLCFQKWKCQSESKILLNVLHTGLSIAL